ncbi:MAG: PIN domain-containing protein, partial [Prevotella sp.]
MANNKFIVLDTNVILNDANNVFNLGSDTTCIVIPETVVDELDSKKGEPGEIGYQAREFGRIIARSTKIEIFTTDNLILHYYKHNDQSIAIATIKKYPDFSDVPAKGLNDRKIIEVALEVQANAKEGIKT